MERGGFMDDFELLERQRAYFATGATRSVPGRIRALLALRDAIRAQTPQLEAAMEADFGKPAAETYMTEIGLVLTEIRDQLRHVRRWSRTRRVPTPLMHFPAKSYIAPEPYGVVLILAPWNYPIQLCLAPLAGAIAAGNCAVVKPSAYAPHTSRAIRAVIEQALPPEHAAVIEGGRAENQALLHERFDYIFFTGSQAVGRVVMQAAAEHLTPVSLELGGKSPVIVDDTADVETAARRIAFGKVTNAGQTCVAPDYAFVREPVLQQFLDAYQKALAEFFPDGDWRGIPAIVNERHFERLRGLLAGQPVVLGGTCDEKTRRIEPTVICPADPDSAVMQEEIFGPILPVLPYGHIRECIAFINRHEKPLALYLFTRDCAIRQRVLATCSFGGGCVNDTLVHLSNPHLPFGGVGASGMGSYHGKKSFDTFTHERSVLRKSPHVDIRLRYRPYTAAKEKLYRLFLR